MVKRENVSVENAIRTAIEVSVYFIKEKIGRRKGDVAILCGGGARNTFFVKRISEELSFPVETSEEFGIKPEYVEPILFAYLGYLRIKGKRIYMKNITGANHPYLPGKICLV
jgi:anhydro-N-acetylmuramic acid kinase